MAMKIPFVSTLNPNAPFFVATVYVAAKGFSPEWWSLIQTVLRFWRVSDEGDVLPLKMKTTSWLKSWMGLADLKDGDKFLDFKEHVLEHEIALERTCTLITRMVGSRSTLQESLQPLFVHWGSLCQYVWTFFLSFPITIYSLVLLSCHSSP